MGRGERRGEADDGVRFRDRFGAATLARDSSPGTWTVVVCSRQRGSFASLSASDHHQTLARPTFLGKYDTSRLAERSAFADGSSSPSSESCSGPGFAIPDLVLDHKNSCYFSSLAVRFRCSRYRLGLTLARRLPPTRPHQPAPRRVRHRALPRRRHSSLEPLRQEDPKRRLAHIGRFAQRVEEIKGLCHEVRCELVRTRKGGGAIWTVLTRRHGSLVASETQIIFASGTNQP